MLYAAGHRGWYNKIFFKAYLFQVYAVLKWSCHAN